MPVLKGHYSSMPIKIDGRKPRIELLPFPLARTPLKNCAFNLLYRHLETANPARGLDAGTGQFRNRWMFPGEYVGITKHRSEYFDGFKHSRPIKRTGPMAVYLMTLERDFSFLGPMDVCVSTYTLQYVETYPDVIERLAQRVRRGGSLFIQNELPTLDASIKAVESHFSDIEVIFTEYAGLSDLEEGSDVVRLSALEMHAPNRAEDHASYCLIARGKIQPEAPAGPTPAIRNDGGLLIVERDLDQCS